jgi:hypothetical protein
MMAAVVHGVLLWAVASAVHLSILIERAARSASALNIMPMCGAWTIPCTIAHGLRRMSMIGLVYLSIIDLFAVLR